MKKEVASSSFAMNEFYLSENLEFKDEARRIIIKKLGFEPEVKVSMNGELVLRQ